MITTIVMAQETQNSGLKDGGPMGEGKTSQTENVGNKKEQQNDPWVEVRIKV